LPILFCKDISMNKNTLILALSGLILAACQSADSPEPVSDAAQPGQAPVDADAGPNPFFEESDAAFGAPRFDLIEARHFAPALDAAMAAKREEIDAIVNNPEEPDFDNTIVALERSGSQMLAMQLMLNNQTGAHTNEELQAVDSEYSGKLAVIDNEEFLNDALFQRVKAVWESRDSLDLNPEQQTLLKNKWEEFALKGANLSTEDKGRLSALNEKLAEMETLFSQKLLADTNAFELVLEEGDLDGLPASALAIGAATARERELEGKWVYTLSRTSFTPFITYSGRRDLREKIFRGYSMRGANGNDNDTRELIREMANLRIERAQLLGYKNHAEVRLVERMAKNPENAYGLLNQVWEPALNKARAEAEDLQAMIDADGHDFKVQPWDWWYYTEKVRKEKYDIDEEQLRQYFVLDNVRDAMFAMAGQLFGITFTERPDIPVYQEDVKTYEVKDSDGSHIGVLYNDYFARPSKRGGAWMNDYRQQQVIDGVNVTPILYNVWNYSKPEAGKPSLLSWDEVETLFHEFGHALHGLLSEANYASVSGTNTPRDYVEFPSQVLENWANEPEVIRSFAFHWETGEAIPAELIDRLQASSTFNQGFVTLEFMAAAMLDMAWHTRSEAITESAEEFEDRVLGELGLIPQIISRYKSPYFAHIFGGDYSAGYYSYLWSEVLDADAFERFKQEGILNPETGADFRKHILSSGSTEDVAELYRRFRGQDPEIGPLMKRRGLITGP